QQLYRIVRGVCLPGIVRSLLEAGGDAALVCELEAAAVKYPSNIEEATIKIPTTQTAYRGAPLNMSFFSLISTVPVSAVFRRRFTSGRKAPPIVTTAPSINFGRGTKTINAMNSQKELRPATAKVHSCATTDAIVDTSQTTRYPPSITSHT